MSVHEDLPSDGHFEELPPEECLRLLRERSVGRMAFVGPAGLSVVPLAYTVVGEQVLVRTAPGTELARLEDAAEVAFQVDEFDADLANGWSVLVRGRLARARQVPQQAMLPTPFVPGERNLVLVLEPGRLSGRAVSAG